jgi:hypothetical protein
MSEHILTHKHQTHKHQAHNHAASGWRIHCCVEVTELSTNKQHSLTQSEHFFSPRHSVHIHPHARRVFASSFSTGPPGDQGALHCRWPLKVIATQPIGLVPLQSRGILPVAEEQSRTRGGQSGCVEGQPQCRGLWHSIGSSPSARSLSLSHSSPPPSSR